MTQIVPIQDLKGTTEIFKMLMQDVYEKIDLTEEEFAKGKTKNALGALNELREKHGL